MDAMIRNEQQIMSSWGLTAGILGSSMYSYLSLISTEITASQIIIDGKQNNCAAAINSYSKQSQFYIQNISLYWINVSSKSSQKALSSSIIAYQYGEQYYQNDTLREITLKNSYLYAISSQDKTFIGGICGYDYLVSQKIIDVIIKQTYMASNSIQSCLGGISGYIVQSEQQIQNIEIYNSQINSNSLNNVWAGGIVGLITQSSNIIIQNVINKNSNISSQVQNVYIDQPCNSVVGGAIGMISVSSAQLLDINIINVNLTSSGYIYYVSSLVATILTNSSSNLVQIMNCVIQSVKIWYSGTYNNVGFVLEIQQPSTVNNFHCKYVHDRNLNRERSIDPELLEHSSDCCQWRVRRSDQRVLM
ncbi:Hypothetical_protein [Hexamita inflata]|uniref:Hypothetical_protein n=2 Tax=Hexamita inflata TaxID=28002 RepID=A0AA86QBR0_9EUKA|nr:Hypothetical protein HINF_LOCUS43939 [Hexamita inflata]